jgi:hypothetical protein
MADLKSILKTARQNAADAKMFLANLSQVRDKINDFDTKGKAAIESFIDDYPDALTGAMEDNNTKMTEHTKQIVDYSIGLQRQVESAKSTLALITASADGGYTDPTSQKILLDLSATYKVLYIVVCCKVVIFFVTMAYIFSMRNAFLTFATFVAVVVVYYTWTFIVNFFEGNNTGGGDTNEGKLCSDGTESNANGSNCPAKPPAPQTPYYSCDQSPFGCCVNGLPSKTADRKGCAQPLVCASTLYGCCPDGLTERLDETGTNCDFTYYDSSCADSQFGCCPNGMVKIDAEGTNCTLASACGVSAFGCCPDGELRTDIAGSDCAENKLEK